VSLARDVFFRGLSRIEDARFELRDPAGVRVFGDESASLRASVDILDPRLYGRILRRGEVALGEGYTDGLWTSPDLFATARVAVRNAAAFRAGRSALAVAAALSRAAQRRKHRRRTNSLAGSKRNIAAHYDLGNDFYALFLDRRHMAYSCAFFDTPDASLEDAQEAKFERIARKLGLDASHHVLEIGTGWGGFAVWAASRYGCRVTTTTISHAQHDYARKRIDRANLADRVTLLYEDYRRLSGTFDRIVSIEMFEAVGLPHYDEFFGAMERLLSPRGAMLLQTITMNEQCFSRYRRRADWIQLYVFPGAELASVSEVLRSIGRVSRLTLVNLEDIGLHYVRTLLSWRERFLASVAAVGTLGFDERFVRLWDYYLAACAAAFAERHIGDAQMLFVKHPSGDRLQREHASSDPVRAPRRAAAGS
jgi:cyclopropane-fatty-acyl-phospholipid synthase